MEFPVGTRIVLGSGNYYTVCGVSDGLYTLIWSSGMKVLGIESSWVYSNADVFKDAKLILPQAEIIKRFYEE